jgi:hypothetical protein
MEKFGYLVDLCVDHTNFLIFTYVREIGHSPMLMTTCSSKPPEHVETLRNTEFAVMVIN